MVNQEFVRGGRQRMEFDKWNFVPARCKFSFENLRENIDERCTAQSANIVIIVHRLPLKVFF